MDKIKDIYISKSFVCLGDSLPSCFDCKYCRLIDEWDKNISYTRLPHTVNEDFLNLPVVVNLFYGDPMLQVDNTVSYLKALEAVGHKGPVVVITKGDFRKFPDIPFNLDLHIAFSTFGISDGLTYDEYDGSSFVKFIHNLEVAVSRNYIYKYSIEFRPIIYGINDSKYSIDAVISVAASFDLPVGYSGLQGKPNVVKVWQDKGLPFNPYPGFEFGHKKSLSVKVASMIKNLAAAKNVKVFKKTSCLLSYVHNLDRDYNAHYYRPNEVDCNDCVMRTKCEISKSLRDELCIEPIEVPFNYKLVSKENHICILKKKGICEFPTSDCSHISGGIIEIKDKLTTADVRVIKWLTGYTVDADFVESPYLSDRWLV